VAVSCDAIQVYEGLDVLSGAPTAAERGRLEHRLVGFVPIDGEFSAGRFAHLAHSEIDQLIAEARRPIVVGGTGLYMRAALAELDLRPPVPSEVRAEVEADLAARGAEALHAELPPELASGVHPNDRKRIARLTELGRLGIAAPATGDGLWSEGLRVPTTLVGLTVDRDLLRTRIEARVDAMLRLGAAEEVRSAQAAGASRTARAAIGFGELLKGDADAMNRAQWRYARRQLTWMRRMEDVEMIDRGGRDDAEVAAEIVAVLDADEQ
jgi:tRNA dimethylallyltransferase